MIGEEKEDGKKVHAKDVSKWAKIVIGIVLLALCVLKWTGVLSHATVWEICGACAVVYGIVAGTIDLNIVLDKFMGGGESPDR